MRLIRLKCLGVRLTLVSFTLGLASCLDVAKDSKFADLEEVQLLCHQNQSTECKPANNGKLAFIGLTSNNVDCRVYFNSLPSDQPLYKYFDASSVVKSEMKGLYLEALATRWVSEINVLVRSLLVQKYQACAFVDLDADGRWQANEPIGFGEITPGQKGSIEDWL